MFQVQRLVNEQWSFWSEHFVDEDALADASTQARKYADVEFRVVDQETLKVVPMPTDSFQLQRFAGDVWKLEGDVITDDQQAKDRLKEVRAAEPDVKFRMVDLQHLTKIETDPVAASAAVNPGGAAPTETDGLDT